MTCDKVCCSPFFSYQDPEPTLVPDLTNDIHPIFDEIWFVQSPDYDVIRMPLRLASRFLTMDSVVKLLVVMADGQLTWKNSLGVHVPVTDAQIRQLPKPVGGKPWEIQRCPHEHHNTVTDAMRGRAKEILEQARGMFTYNVHENTVPGGTTHILIGPLTRERMLHFPLGSESHIEICKFAYDVLVAQKSSLVNPGPDLLRTMHASWFNLATCMLHELFHALDQLFNNISRDCVYYYLGSSLAETGFAVEAALFGGPIHILQSYVHTQESNFCPEGLRRQPHRFSYLMHKWPSELMLAGYRSGGFIIGARNGPGFARSTKLYRIPASFIEQLFLTEYWDATGSKVGRGILPVPKVGFWYGRFNEATRKIEVWLTQAERDAAPDKSRVRQLVP